MNLRPDNERWADRCHVQGCKYDSSVVLSAGATPGNPTRRVELCDRCTERGFRELGYHRKATTKRRLKRRKRKLQRR